MVFSSSSMVVGHFGEDRMKRATANAELFEAIGARSVEGVRSALARGASLDETNERGRKPFFNAVGFEDMEIIRLLIASGANPTDGLIASMMRRNEELARFLIEAGADVQARLTDSGQTVLHAACDCGMVGLVRYLVNEKHLDLNSRMDDGTTALQLAESVGLDLGDLAKDRTA